MDLAREPMLNDALERCIERISEATRHIDDAVKANYPAVPWRAIADIGNRLRHSYFAINSQIIWNVATLELPALRSTIEDIRSHSAP